jgi:hypothetical protein
LTAKQARLPAVCAQGDRDQLFRRLRRSVR